MCVFSTFESFDLRVLILQRCCLRCSPRLHMTSIIYHPLSNAHERRREREREKQAKENKTLHIAPHIRGFDPSPKEAFKENNLDSCLLLHVSGKHRSDLLSLNSPAFSQNHRTLNNTK